MPVRTGRVRVLPAPSRLAGATAAPAGGASGPRSSPLLLPPHRWCVLVEWFSGDSRKDGFSRLDHLWVVSAVSPSAHPCLPPLNSVWYPLVGDRRFCDCCFGCPLVEASVASEGSYLVDPASSHMLVSKIKPCMSKYKLLYTVKLRMAH